MLLEETKNFISLENPSDMFKSFITKKTKNRCPPLMESSRSHGSPLSLVSPAWTGAWWRRLVSGSPGVPGYLFPGPSLHWPVQLQGVLFYLSETF